jgi:hypothetical protein
VDARQRLEPAARRLEQQVPPLGHGLGGSHEQLVVARREGDRRCLAPGHRLGERLGKRPPEPEGLADGAHLGAEPRLGLGELLEVEPRRLHRDVVERGLERRGRLAGDVVRELVERVAHGEQRGELRDRKAGRLRGERRRARDAGVHLDHAQLAGLRVHRELDVRAARRDPDRPRGRERGVAEALVEGVGQRLLRRDRPRVAGVDAHRVEVLDRAHDDGVPARVAHHLELVLLPAGEVLLDEDLAGRARRQPVRDHGPQLGRRVRDPAAGAAERERRPHDRRHREVDVGRAGDDASRHRQTDRLDGGTEELAVLGAADRIEVGADQLDSERRELDREVQRRLPAQRRQDRVGPLALDHLGDGRGVERLEVRRVGPLGVGHDRRRVRVHEHDAEALAAQHAARLRAGVVELARLPDPDRPRAEDQDRAKVGALRQLSARRSKKGRASSGPGEASGWNWTLAKPSPARPSQVPSFRDT